MGSFGSVETLDFTEFTFSFNFALSLAFYFSSLLLGQSISMFTSMLSFESKPPSGTRTTSFCVIFLELYSLLSNALN
jgi:hypothetical protein